MTRLNRRAFLNQAAAVGLSAQAIPSLWAAETPRRSPAVAQRPLYWSWWGWETIDHYRRAGGTPGAVDSTAPWLEAWYDRLHDEQTVRQMAELGVNLGITHFFKGFGLAHEAQQQQRTRDLVQKAHRHGVAVLGYCQSRSLYYEAFLKEEPRAADWIQRDRTGELMTWGGAYYRWAPCLSSSEFRAYLKRVIRFGLEEIGLDGLHFDNDYAEACYCPRCQAAFRQWLARRWPNPRTRFGLADFDAVRIPPSGASPSRIADPLAAEWVRFRCELLAEYHADITSHARRIRPDVILLGNPAHPRGFDGPFKRSVWAPWVGQHLDLMFAENGQFPAMNEGRVVSQVRAYKQAAAVGYRVVSTTWRRGKETGLGLPEAAHQVGLQVCEAAAFGGIPGTNWSLRPLGDGNKMQIDRPEMREALGHYLGFVRGNARRLAGARPVRDVAVLHTFASAALNPGELWPVLMGTEEVLIRKGFAWEVLFDETLSKASAFGSLVLAQQTHLSDAACETIGRLAGGGTGLVLIGENGRYDESGRQRGRDPFQQLSGPRVVRVDAKLARAKVDAGYTIEVTLPPGATKLAAAVETALKPRGTVRLLDADTMALAAWELPDKSLALHLVNYAAPEAVQGAKLRFDRAWRDAKTAELLVPGKSPAKIAVSGGSIALPPIELYGVVIVPA